MAETPISATEGAQVGLVLASGSPRRRALLDRFGLTYRCWVPGSDEDGVAARYNQTDSPAELVQRLARTKHRDALAALARAEADHPAVANAGGEAESLAISPSAVVIAADTIVVRSGDVLGKPPDRVALYDLVRSYSSTSIDVATAVVVARRNEDEPIVETVTTRVSFRSLRDAEIAAYVGSGEGEDKAGGLSLQGGARGFIESVDGCWTNVIGLPLCATRRLLRSRDVAVEQRCRDRDGNGCSRA